MRLMLGGLVWALGLATVPGPETFDPGPAVGDRLPAFEAVDQDGRARNFESLRGARGLVLLFFRSADW